MSLLLYQGELLSVGLIGHVVFCSPIVDEGRCGIWRCVATAGELRHRECVYVIILGDTFVFLGVITAFRKRYQCHKSWYWKLWGKKQNTCHNEDFEHSFSTLALSHICLDSVVQRLWDHPYMHIDICSSLILLWKIQFYTPGLLCIIFREPSFHKDVPGFIYP